MANDNNNRAGEDPTASGLPATSYEYVGLLKRTLAAAIDALILLVVSVPLQLAIYGKEYFSYAQKGEFAGFWDFVIQFVLPSVAVILLWKYRGATPGKMAISAKIVDAATGRTPTTGKLLLRYFAYLASMLPLFLGFFWIAFDRRKQGFHDKIAGTVVIYDDD